MFPENNRNQIITIMEKILEAILTQPEARSAESAELIAAEQAEFLSWQ